MQTISGNSVHRTAITISSYGDRTRKVHGSRRSPDSPVQARRERGDSCAWPVCSEIMSSSVSDNHLGSLTLCSRTGPGLEGVCDCARQLSRRASLRGRVGFPGGRGCPCPNPPVTDWLQ